MSQQFTSFEALEQAASGGQTKPQPAATPTEFINNQLDYKQATKDNGTREGNIISNAGREVLEIGAAISTLASGILGFDEESRAVVRDLFDIIRTQSASENSKMLVNGALEAYNIALDDFGKLSLGEMAGRILEGAFENPVTATLDLATLGKYSGAGKLVTSLARKVPIIDNQFKRAELAAEVAKDNMMIANEATDFMSEVKRIEGTYSPKEIELSMQAIETVGFKNAPERLLPCMRDLSKLNDSYKSLAQRAGAEILEDAEFATRELIAKQTGIPFEKASNLKETKLWERTQKYVEDNDIRPLFHFEPKIAYDELNIKNVTPTDLLKRTYGTMDYADAAKNFAKNAQSTMDALVRSEQIKSVGKLNNKIDNYNAAHGTKIGKLNDNGTIFGSRFLGELNSELKKTMLGAGIYLGANAVSTTLTILNNFNLDAAVKTLKELPKYKVAKLREAESFGLKNLSKINNLFYAPVAGADRWLEELGRRYINNVGIDKLKYMQSLIPSYGVASNALEQMMRTLIPFGSYPAAAVKEIIANVTGKPVKTLAYSQVEKLGEYINKEAQEKAGVKKVDTTKVIRKDDEGNLVQRSTVVTPIQAASMFILGTQGDAVQIPIVNFINDLVAGTGDPSKFKVMGKTYTMNKGVIETDKGQFNMIPAITFVARKTMTPLQVYNQILVPLLSDKYIRRSKELTDAMIDDATYASLNSANKRKVVTNAREKLGKRLTGTYEYNYYEPKVGRTAKFAVRQQIINQQNLEQALRKNK